MDKSIVYATIMLFAGIGIPIMASLNAKLGIALKSPVLAVVVLLVVASLTILTLVPFQASLSNLEQPKLPFYYFLAGVIFIFYILPITWITPKFGLGNAIFFILLGQLISSAVIDHTGAFGATQIPIDMTRIIGLILMAAGVCFYVKFS
jgi:transporter family-2 protein